MVLLGRTLTQALLIKCCKLTSVFGSSETCLPELVFSKRLTRVLLVTGISISIGLAAGLSPPETPEDLIMRRMGLKSGELITVGYTRFSFPLSKQTVARLLFELKKQR